MSGYSRNTSGVPEVSAKLVGCGLLGVVGVTVGMIFLFPWIGAFQSMDAGHIGVERNGGWFSNSNERGFLDPQSSMTNTGIYSTIHTYPAQQRTYTISADPNQGDKVGVDVVQTPSSDGVEMGIEGTLYYSLNLDHQTLGVFDNLYGTRTYTDNGNAFHAYDGDQGWGAFIDVAVRPILNNDLRELVAQTSCAELDSACALVQNSTQQAAVVTGGVNNNGNIAAVQDKINATLQQDLDTQLNTAVDASDLAKHGGKPFQFLTGVRFTIVRVSLPSNVQGAVNDAQAAYAEVSKQQALVKQAQLQAEANAAKEAGYKNCPACQTIDELGALPKGLLSLGSGSGLNLATQ